MPSPLCLPCTALASPSVGSRFIAPCRRQAGYRYRVAQGNPNEFPRPRRRLTVLAPISRILRVIPRDSTLWVRPYPRFALRIDPRGSLVIDCTNNRSGHIAHPSPRRGRQVKFPRRPPLTFRDYDVSITRIRKSQLAPTRRRLPFPGIAPTTRATGCQPVEERPRPWSAFHGPASRGTRSLLDHGR